MDNESLSRAINKAVGEELRGLRAKRKVSRERLRELTGLGLSTIQRIENGERSPELNELVTILQNLDMPLQDFLAQALKSVEGV